MGDAHNAPVLTHKLIDLAPLIIHANQICKTWFALGTSLSGQKKEHGYMLLGFQFLAQDTKMEAFSATEYEKIRNSKLSCNSGMSFV